MHTLEPYMTKTKKFCKWYFNIDLSEFALAGESYIVPSWFAHEKMKRVYLHLYETKGVWPTLAMKLGYINADTSVYVPNTAVSGQVETLGLTAFIHKNMHSLITVGKHGIEGAMARPDDSPLREILDHVKSTMTVKREDEFWNIYYHVRGLVLDIGTLTELAKVFSRYVLDVPDEAVRHADVGYCLVSRSLIDSKTNTWLEKKSYEFQEIKEGKGTERRLHEE